jgi:tRNA(Ile)-lysidine synthase TilS/MesJ
MYLVREMVKNHPRNTIIVAHFNHNLRGSESDGDEEFLRVYCENN